MGSDVRRRGQGLSLLALAGLCVLVSTLVLTAGSPNRSTPAAAGATATGKPSATTSGQTVASSSSGYPTLPSGYFRQGGTYSPIVQQVNKAKVVFTLPKVIMLVDQHVTPRPQPNPLTWEDVTARVFVAAPAGSGSPVGAFPPVGVAVLGFGLLPVTATIHITQIPDGTSFEPLSLNFSFSGRSDSTGWLYEGPLSLSGNVDIRVSDVVVDQVPLPVGDNCHTGTPAKLDLEAAAGRYKNSPPIREPADLFLPEAVVPGKANGTVDVPAFTGCHNGQEVLDPLLTAMVSGPGNPISATQVGPLGTFIPPTS